jgi:high-affinity Fe2+/Pb2+ permease
MIRLYRGQIYAGAAVILGIVAFAIGYHVLSLGGVSGLWEFFLVMTGAAAVIMGLVLCALAYVWWVPKWERDEKRTGHVPGEKENDEHDQRALPVQTLD